MPELHVRNLPADLHARLRQRAEAEGRSMSAEAVVLLSQVLHIDASGRVPAADRLPEIRDRNRLVPGQPPAEQLVRDDRDAAR